MSFKHQQLMKPIYGSKSAHLFQWIEKCFTCGKRAHCQFFKWHVCIYTLGSADKHFSLLGSKSLKDTNLIKNEEDRGPEQLNNMPELVNSEAENSIQVSNGSLVISSPNWNLQVQITLGESLTLIHMKSKR